MDNGAKHKPLLSQVADYYSAKLAEYGQKPQGVDWNGEEGQQLRFAQLTKIILSDGPFSINDLGCGYGALYDYLSARHASFNYVGCDISEQMIAAGIERHRGCGNIRYLVLGRRQDA
jgi:SAM-dependent methyltransferase